jgi:hypothetical protein
MLRKVRGFSPRVLFCEQWKETTVSEKRQTSLRTILDATCALARRGFAADLAMPILLT